MLMKTQDASAAWIGGVIADYVRNAPENNLRDAARSAAFDTPLVGFAAGDDPLFEAYRYHVGPFHWTPQEAFGHVCSEAVAASSDLTVIAWILPQTGSTKRDNRHADQFPAESWARARTYGEKFNAALRVHLVDRLRAAGIAAVAPMLISAWEKRRSERTGLASTWSERHAAYACGLGTFGLCDGLITPVGKAVRMGSIVARMRITPSSRPYTDHHEYCLFFSKGTCGKCMARCPAGAITEAGHDKDKCRAYLQHVATPHIRAQYGFEGRGCGLCQTGVPCESVIPLHG